MGLGRHLHAHAAQLPPSGGQSETSDESPPPGGGETLQPFVYVCSTPGRRGKDVSSEPLTLPRFSRAAALLGCLWRWGFAPQKQFITSQNIGPKLATNKTLKTYLEIQEQEPLLFILLVTKGRLTRRAIPRGSGRAHPTSQAQREAARGPSHPRTARQPPSDL